MLAKGQLFLYLWLQSWVAITNKKEGMIWTTEAVLGIGSGCGRDRIPPTDKVFQRTINAFRNCLGLTSLSMELMVTTWPSWASNVALGKSFHLFGPQVPHSLSGDRWVHKQLEFMSEVSRSNLGLGWKAAKISLKNKFARLKYNMLPRPWIKLCGPG